LSLSEGKPQHLCWVVEGLTSPLINIKDNPLFISPCHHPVNSMEEQCTFCKIIKGEKPTEFLYQDESLVVFRDIRPHAPIHLLIVPREHIRSLNDLKEKDKDILFKMIVKAMEMGKSPFHRRVRLSVGF
jgi:hypothetical protein